MVTIVWAVEAWGLPGKVLNEHLEIHSSWWQKEVAEVILKAMLFFSWTPEGRSNSTLVSLKKVELT